MAAAAAAAAAAQMARRQATGEVDGWVSAVMNRRLSSVSSSSSQ